MSRARSVASTDAQDALTTRSSEGRRPRPYPDEGFDDAVARAEWLEDVLCETFGMDPQDAKMICGLVIEQFGDKDEVLDDEIPTDVRSVFYTLEAKRILTFRRIEYENEDGATLRGFFWRFHRDWQPPETAAQETQDDSVYEKLPEDCWDREAVS